MESSKEFSGKTLDAAIAEACVYYGVPREKLEIDIIEDAKTGIFGIVGARKAKISARVALLPGFIIASGATGKESKEVKSIKREEKESHDPEASPACISQESVEDRAPKNSLPDLCSGGGIADGVLKAESAGEDQPQHVALPSDGKDLPADDSVPANLVEEPVKSRKDVRRSSRKPAKAAEQDRVQAAKEDDQESHENSLPCLPLTELDQAKLTTEIKTVLAMLASPVLGIDPAEMEMAMDVTEDCVTVSLRGDDTGLLIGRDGQNLAAIQYLAARIISRNMAVQIHLHVDAGDYHLRQDSRLQELAVTLADRVRQTGKPQSTRPLSAYQRRVIHLALQDDPDVLTRSSGDGALKHVVILRRKD